MASNVSLFKNVHLALFRAVAVFCKEFVSWSLLDWLVLSLKCTQRYPLSFLTSSGLLFKLRKSSTNFSRGNGTLSQFEFAHVCQKSVLIWFFVFSSFILMWGLYHLRGRCSGAFDSCAVISDNRLPRRPALSASWAVPREAGTLLFPFG